RVTRADIELGLVERGDNLLILARVIEQLKHLANDIRRRASRQEQALPRYGSLRQAKLAVARIFRRARIALVASHRNELRLASADANLRSGEGQHLRLNIPLGHEGGALH